MLRGGGSTSVSIGYPVSGGTATRVLYVDASGNLAGSASLVYDDSTKRFTVGSTSADATAGLIAGNLTSAYGALWASRTATPGTANYAFAASVSNTIINVATGGTVDIRANNADTKFSQGTTAGAGPSITAGTATTDVNALNLTQTWNAGGVAFTGLKFTVTSTAQAAGSKFASFVDDATEVFAVDQAGAVKLGNTVAAAVAVASTHKVTFDIAGTTYYLLATNVA